MMRANVVFSNCSNSYHPTLTANVARYVDAGGWLVSSDWSLHYVIERAFPGTIRWTRGRTGDEVIPVEPGSDSLWSDVVVLGADPQWWLWGSYPIEVIDAGRVRVEAASHELLVRYRTPVVAVRFDWGYGHVFHVISHFHARRSDTPTERHRRPFAEFLEAGMRLSPEGIRAVTAAAGSGTEDVTFAMLQSAVVATELVAQLCVEAIRRDSAPGGIVRSWMRRIFLPAN